MTNKEAIRTLEANYPDACFEQLREAVDAAIEALKALDAAGDTISRQAAIDAILAVTGNSSVRELYEHVQEHELSDMWSGGVNAAIDIIIAVPPVQTESKETSSTHKALDTISRQAAIDALDKIFPADPMRNDYTQGITCGAALATEYIKQLPFAQPETIRCKDCKYWMPHSQLGFDEDNGTYHDYCERLIPEDEYYAFYRDADDYCSFAERMKGGDRNDRFDQQAGGD